MTALVIFFVQAFCKQYAIDFIRFVCAIGVNGLAALKRALIGDCFIQILQGLKFDVDF